MQIKFPYNKRELSDGQIIDHPGEMAVEVDITVRAEERWEAHFPKLAENETVFAYVERLQNTKQTATNRAAIILSSIKALYCFLLSPELPDFNTFAGLFDLSDEATTKKQIAILELAFGIVAKGSTASSKN